MQLAWLFFKILECLLAISTGYHHMSGFGGEEHEYYICAAVGAYTILLLIAIFGTCLGEGNDLDMKTEIIYSGFGALLFLGCSLGAMYAIENDFQLQYLTDREELEYKPFQYSKAESIICFTSCLLSALHCCLAIDRYVSSDDNIEKLMADPNFDRKAMGSLEVYVMGKKGDAFLRRFRWFRNLEARTGRDTKFRRDTIRDSRQSSRNRLREQDSTISVNEIKKSVIDFSDDRY